MDIDSQPANHPAILTQRTENWQAAHGGGILFTRILRLPEERKAQLIEAVRNGSVATWGHFNLHGEFDFSDERMVDSIGLALPKNPPFEEG